MKKKTNNNFIFNFITLFVWIIVVVILISLHENWRDEAQAWFIVKDLNIIDIFKQLKYEGHPFLWYMVLLPFAKLGFNYCIINYISTFFVGISVYLILFKTNINKFTKLVICFSPGFLYFFPVIARSYCLIPPLIIAIALLHDKKECVILYNILILLLLNTHLLVVPFCLILILIELIDLIKQFDKKKLIAIFVALFGVLILILQLFGCLNMNDEVAKNFDIVQFLRNSFMYVFIYFVAFIVSNNKKYDLKWCLLLFLSSFGFYFVYYFSNTFSNQKIIILCLFTAVGLILAKSKLTKLYLVTCFIILFFQYYPFIFDDIKLNYSSSKEISKFINQNIKINENIVVIDDFCISSIAGYAPNYNYINIFENNTNRFNTWSKERSINREKFFSSDDYCSYIATNVDLEKYYIIINDNYFNLINCENWKLLYKTAKSLENSEQYKIYYVENK